MNRKRLYFENYGCPSNKFDLEVMRTYLEGLGHVAIESPESADILIINTCGVKKVTEDRILKHLQFLKSLDKPIVVTGCLTKIDPEALTKAVPDYLALLDPFSIDKIPIVIDRYEDGMQNQRFFSTETKVKVKMPMFSKGRLLQIVPISEGCLGLCAFCCTRFARGQLFSYPQEIIVDRIRQLICDGAREIWLTAQDTGAYGLDSDCNLATLLEEICKVRGKFLLRVGMMNPNNALQILNRLVEAYKSEKVFKFLHIPVQSGSDSILKLMNRYYDINDFRRIVDTFRREIPELSISTDIICGFPGEDEKSFEDSLRLIKNVEPDIVNISKFFPRPNTAAAKMKQLTSQTIKMRSKKMSELCKTISLKKNRCWLNWEGEILIDEKGKGSSMVGRNFAYKPIVVKGIPDLLGKTMKVVITDATPTYLIGELLH